MSTSSNLKLIEFFWEAQSKLVIQTSDLPLKTLAEMVKAGFIDLEPSFQRRQRWEEKAKSQLIESFILNIPVPPIYLSEDEYGKYTAIDWKQRLQAIADFLNDGFRLKGLEDFEWLNNFLFSELPEDIKNTLTIRPFLRVVTLLKQSDPSLRYQVFLRLNKAGVPLNAQEIRNVAFRGALNDRLVLMWQNQFLWSRLWIEEKTKEKSSAYSEMADVEYALRFLTLRYWDEFKGDFRNSMDEFLRLNTTISDAKIEEFEIEFARAVRICERIWWVRAFSRYDHERKIWRDQFLAGVYDAQMQAVIAMPANFEASLNNEKIDSIVTKTIALFNDPDFEDSVRTATNTPKKLKYRIETVRSMLLS